MIKLQQQLIEIQKKLDENIGEFREKSDKSRTQLVFRMHMRLIFK